MREQKSLTRVEEDIDKLKDWLRKQPHLPHKIDHEILACFVNGTKSLEIAKQKLDAYFTIRTTHPKIFDFSVRDPLDPAFKKANSATSKFFLPGTTPEGYRVLFHNLTPTFDECFLHSQEIIKSVMFIEMAMYNWPDMKGIYLIYDLKLMNSSILPKLSPSFLASGLEWFQGSVPVKLKGIYLFNAPSFLESVVEWLLKPFLKKKLYDRMIISSQGNDWLKTVLPEEMIPSDYGGTATQTSEQMTDEWIALMESKRSWFERTAQQLVDEKKRPPDTKCTYGVEGTFRKLAID